MDLRMACLQERLGGLRALTDVFSEANGEVVENAVKRGERAGVAGSLRGRAAACVRSCGRPTDSETPAQSRRNCASAWPT